VYVLDEDESKKLFVLFPVEGLDVTNPLAGGVEHRLPGTRAGILHDWQVTSTGGREWILVIASREPLSPIENEIAAFPRADVSRPIEYREIPSEALSGWRGIGTMTESSASESSPSGTLAEIARRLHRSQESSPGIWIRLFELHGALP
jgi:hypothetical protein